MSASNKRVVIKKGTIVRKFELVDEIRRKYCTTKELPEALEILLDKSSKHVDRSQKSKVKSMLTNYQDVFR